MARCKNELIRRRRTEPGLVTAPSVEAIHLRFNPTPGTMTWPEIVERALRPAAARTMQLAADTRVEATEHLSEAHVAFALSRVARELGATTVRRHEYAPAREAIIAADARRRGGGRLARLMPTRSQIETLCAGNWSAALRLAGLDAEPAEPVDDRRRGAILPDGLPAAQAIVVFVAANGFIPSIPVLTRFAAACGFSLADPDDWPAEVDEAKRLLAARDMSAGEHANRRGGAGRRTVWSYPEGGVTGAPPRGEPLGPVITRQFCELALRVWDLRLPARARRNVESYKGWRAGTGWPSSNAIVANGGFSALRTAAQEANAKELRAGAAREQLADDLTAKADVLLSSGDRPDPLAAWDLDTALAAVQTARELVPDPSVATPASKRQVTLRHLVAAGLLNQDETLISLYGGVRHEASFDEHGTITVHGLGKAHNPSDAARLVVGSPRGGWRIWRVERDGDLILLDVIRERLFDDHAAD